MLFPFSSQIKRKNKMKKWLFTMMMLSLSSCASFEEHAENDMVSGISKVIKKAKEGDANSQLILGDIYRNEYSAGRKESFLQAIYWYEKAAEQGQTYGYYKIGNMYHHGGFGIDKDLTKSIRYYQKAAENGHVDSMIRLGKMYLEGDGVEKDFSKGISFYKQAADNGNIHAQNELGDIYYKYATTSENLKAGRYQQEARYWLTKSTETPYADRANKLLNELDERIKKTRHDEQIKKEMEEKNKKARAELDKAIKTQSYVKQLRQKYGKRLRYETAHAQTRIQSFNIDCRANDGRYLPLENVLLAKMASLDSKQAYLTIRATNRGDDVRIYDELISADGRRMGSIPMFEINKWGELRTLADVRIEAILNSCFGSFGPIWASR
jgi:TPR repeat protein